MQKKYLIFLAALFATAPVLAKPAVIQKSQLIGKWQCIAADKTPMAFTFGNGQEVSATVDITIPFPGTPKDETLTYRHIGNGTWTLNAEKVGLNIKTTNVERLHNPEKIRTAAWRETDNETFAQMRSTIGKPGRLQMQVKQIGNGTMRVRMQGDRNDMTCQKA
ncbi:hypothetical protein [Kingella denitrificans]|uniref:hypothetical protein n=1 Tax=Kingella denitrificans TaxID=502 RepID=UPI0028D6F27C|nr:hypothetical protein [Kingella denitrificans]